MLLLAMYLGATLGGGLLLSVLGWLLELVGAAAEALERNDPKFSDGWGAR